jgi:hypothetical protein
VVAALHTGEIGLLVVLALALTAVVGALFPRLGSPGIVALELAWSPGRAKEIVGRWSANAALGRVRRSIYLDFAFIVAYVAALVFFILLAARVAEGSGLVSDETADTFAWIGSLAMIGAGTLDAVENIGLLLLIRGRIARGWTLLTSACAAVKFALLSAGALAALAALLASLIKWLA